MHDSDFPDPDSPLMRTEYDNTAPDSDPISKSFSREVYADLAMFQMCGELAAVKSTNEASNVSEYRPGICLNGFKAINILPAYVYILSAQYRFRKQFRTSGSFKKGKLFKFSGTVASSAIRYFKSSCLSHSFSGNLCIVGFTDDNYSICLI